jgi:hypothetical protein
MCSHGLCKAKSDQLKFCHQNFWRSRQDQLIIADALTQHLQLFIMTTFQRVSHAAEHASDNQAVRLDLCAEARSITAPSVQV